MDGNVRWQDEELLEVGDTAPILSDFLAPKKP